MSIFRRPLICQQFIFLLSLIRFRSPLRASTPSHPLTFAPGVGIFIFLESVLHQACWNLSTKIKIKLEQVSGCWESSHNLERRTFVEARQSDTITFRKAINFMSSLSSFAITSPMPSLEIILSRNDWHTDFDEFFEATKFIRKELFQSFQIFLLCEYENLKNVEMLRSGIKNTTKRH